MLRLARSAGGLQGLRTLSASGAAAAAHSATENVEEGVGPAAFTAVSAAAAAAAASAAPGSLSDRYAALVRAGTLRHDPAQVRSPSQSPASTQPSRLWACSVRWRSPPPQLSTACSQP